MQTIMWAISSMVVLMLIITLLPLGYTIKGKFTLVLTSFILSLGGLGIVSILPLWETAIILFALIFFAAYFMNKRIGSLIFNENNVFGEVFDEEYESHEPVYDIESLKDVNLVKIDEELALPISSNINLEKDKVSELSSSLVISTIKEIAENEPEAIDEDISFLLERNTEVDEYDQPEVTSQENGYLSDIESLLEIESEQKDLLELSPIVVEDKKPAQLNKDEGASLDDSLFDFLLTKKEVAADRDAIHDEIETKEKVSLQK